MSLPSKYAPGGISNKESQKTITVGKYHKKPIEYAIRTIEQKVDNAVNHSQNVEDIEMVPIDDYNEAILISDYINTSRSSNQIDYDSMDIDGEFSEIIAEPNTSYLVVDTNFALSHLKVLDEIRDQAAEYRLKIIIPITVMKELDGLKLSSKVIKGEEHDKSLKGKTIGHLARWANDWIFNQLSNVNSPVKGQKVRQRIDRTTSKDDAILDCCIFFKESYPANLIVLLSNDKNLCLKALANDILTVSFQNSMSGKMISETIYKESVSRFGTYSEPVLIEKKSPPVIRSPDVSDFHSVSRTIYNEVFTLTKSAIHHTMVSVYEDDIELIRNYDRDSIHSFRDIDSVVRLFWISVFTDYLRKTDFKAGFVLDVPQDLEELKLFVDEWSAVLICIYDKLLSREQQVALHQLVERWESMISSLT